MPAARRPHIAPARPAAAAPPRNIFIYCGEGTSHSAVHQARACLRDALPHFVVRDIDAAQLRDARWRHHAVLLVIPGGRDLFYVRDLQGAANAQIRAFVDGGGSYLGICAGGYYAAAQVRFAENSPQLRVVGPRELRFFAGACVGPLGPFFSYSAADVARLLIVEPQGAAVFYYGGGYFAGAQAAAGVRILARYGPQEAGAAGEAAIVACAVGRGVAVLCGVHPEWDPTELIGAAAQETSTSAAAADARRQALVTEILIALRLA